jgi:serine/threonine protein kinase
VSLPPGTRLGPYEIATPIGAGGMGEVYRASDTRLSRDVAIKVLPAEFARDAQLRARFEREAKAISSLNHPNICMLFDVGSQNDVEYLVMEYLDGEPLTERLARGPMAVSDVLRHGIEIADALDKAHRTGIIHRDLKPGNVILTRSGAKLLDFGLAKAMDAALIASTSPHSITAMLPDEPLTAEGTLVGTFCYMAPEQVEYARSDARTDIFAFGCMLYEMLTGRRAFNAASRAGMIAQIIAGDPPPISTLRPMTPVSLDRVVRTCLAKNPDGARRHAGAAVDPRRANESVRASADGPSARTHVARTRRVGDRAGRLDRCCRGNRDVVEARDRFAAAADHRRHRAAARIALRLHRRLRRLACAVSRRPARRVRRRLAGWEAEPVGAFARRRRAARNRQ